MDSLRGYQRKHLKALAHKLKPIVFVGQRGLTPALTGSTNEALDTHELIKIKFNEFKAKDQKDLILADLTKHTGSELVGMIGHVAILYRRQKDPEKRKIQIPQR